MATPPGSPRPPGTETTTTDVPHEYKKTQKRLKIAAIALIAVGVALAALGILLLVTGNVGGLAPIFIALPFLYAGYNCYRVSDNLNRIIKNPRLIEVENNDDVPGITVKQKIKQVLGEKTIGFKWAIKLAIKKMNVDDL